MLSKTTRGKEKKKQVFARVHNTIRSQYFKYELFWKGRISLALGDLHYPVMEKSPSPLAGSVVPKKQFSHLPLKQTLASWKWITPPIKNVVSTFLPERPHDPSVRDNSPFNNFVVYKKKTKKAHLLLRMAKILVVLSQPHLQSLIVSSVMQNFVTYVSYLKFSISISCQLTR